MGRPTLLLSSSLVALVCFSAVHQASADSAGDYDLPGPGLAYGGIPYGSETGNVAAYFNRGGATYNYKGGVSRGYGGNGLGGRGFRGLRGNDYDLYSRDFD